MNSYIKISVLSFVFFIIGNSSFAEKISNEEKRIYKKAKKALVKENYTEAKENYEKLVKIAPNNDLYSFEAGLSYYFSDVHRTKSIPLFENALKNSKEDTIPELKYYLGRAYHLNGEYDKSKTTLSEFIPVIKSHKSGQRLLKETNYRIRLNNNGLKYDSEKDNNVKITNLGTDINTPYQEYAPVFRKKDSVILFTSRRKQNKGKMANDLLAYEDIYVAKKSDQSTWSIINDKKELSKFLPNNFNSKKHDAGVIYSIDGNTLYTYKKDRLWKSELKNGKWSSLEKLEDNINESQLNVPSVTVSQDGKTMFFVATKKDGFGGSDIYKSIRNENEKWSEPEILGAEINTQHDEDGPFLSNDGSTFYFSSKGHNGIGGYDIFKCKMIDGKPTSPVNLGIPINSPVDDIYIVVEDDNELGFFSSDREGTVGGMDIFSFDISCPNIENTEIRGIVYNKGTKTPLESKLTLKNSDKNNIVNEASSLASNGKFLMVAAPENSYQLTVDAVGFNSQSINITIPKQCEFFPLFSEIALENLKKGDENYQVVTLRNSYFNTNDAIAAAEKNGTINTSLVENEVPLNNNITDKDFEHDKLLMALTRTIDTANSDLAYVIISDTIKVEIPDTADLITFYEEFFGYNKNEINTANSNYTALINSVATLIQLNGKAEIEIESSASKVPTKTHKTNINLASLRGDQARDFIIKSLAAKGISDDKIVVNKINSIVSGPSYRGDYKSPEKYQKFQYVKITVK